MSSSQELKNIVKKNELTIQSIKMAIEEINSFERSFLSQMLNGGVDKASDVYIKQSLDQIEVSREDKQGLLNEKDRLEKETHAAIEELINLFRDRVGLPAAASLDMPFVYTEEEEPKNARIQRHPGNVSPNVIGARNNK